MYYAEEISYDDALSIKYYHTRTEISSVSDCAEFCFLREFCRSAVFNVFASTCSISYDWTINCRNTLQRFTNFTYNSKQLVRITCMDNCLGQSSIDDQDSDARRLENKHEYEYGLQMIKDLKRTSTSAPDHGESDENNTKQQQQSLIQFDSQKQGLRPVESSTTTEAPATTSSPNADTNHYRVIVEKTGGGDLSQIIVQIDDRFNNNGSVYKAVGELRKLNDGEFGRLYDQIRPANKPVEANQILSLKQNHQATDPDQPPKPNHHMVHVKIPFSLLHNNQTNGPDQAVVRAEDEKIELEIPESRFQKLPASYIDNRSGYLYHIVINDIKGALGSRIDGQSTFQSAESSVSQQSNAPDRTTIATTNTAFDVSKKSQSKDIAIETPKKCFGFVRSQRLNGAAFRNLNNVTLNECKCSCMLTWKIDKDWVTRCKSFQYDQSNETCALNSDDHTSKFDLVYDMSTEYHYMNCSAEDFARGRLLQCDRQQSDIFKQVAPIVSISENTWDLVTNSDHALTIRRRAAVNNSKSTELNLADRKASDGTTNDEVTGNFRSNDPQILSRIKTAQLSFSSKAKRSVESIGKSHPRRRSDLTTNRLRRIERDSDFGDEGNSTKLKSPKKPSKLRNLLKKKGETDVEGQREGATSNNAFGKESLTDLLTGDEVKPNTVVDCQPIGDLSPSDPILDRDRIPKDPVINPTNTDVDVLIDAVMEALTLADSDEYEDELNSVPILIGSSYRNQQNLTLDSDDRVVLDIPAVGNKCFEIIHGYLMNGSAGGIEHNVSFEECQCACVTSRIRKHNQIRCRSATYYHNERDCVLNIHSRVRHPGLFIKSDKTDLDVTYMGMRCRANSEDCEETSAHSVNESFTASTKETTQMTNQSDEYLAQVCASFFDKDTDCADIYTITDTTLLTARPRVLLQQESDNDTESVIAASDTAINDTFSDTTVNDTTSNTTTSDSELIENTTDLLNLNGSTVSEASTNTSNRIEANDGETGNATEVEMKNATKKADEPPLTVYPSVGPCTYSAIYQSSFGGSKLIKKVFVSSPAQCFFGCHHEKCRSLNLINQKKKFYQCEFFRDALIDYRTADVLGFDSNAIYFDGIGCGNNIWH